MLLTILKNRKIIAKNQVHKKFLNNNNNEFILACSFDMKLALRP